jgi:DHA1 family bicyclomycin/chloramphenicol resistance-like MFS transporter
MAKYQLTTREFGIAFAILSIGMIGGGQFNVLLSRSISIAKIFRNSLYLQLLMAVIYVIASSAHALNLYTEFAILFISISCVGLVYPNAAALALAPFEKNSGSAAALLGTLQMMIGATAGAIFGILNFDSSTVLAALFFIAAILGVLIFRTARGKKHSSH